MAFFTSAIGVLQKLVIGLGAGTINAMNKELLKLSEEVIKVGD